MFFSRVVANLFFLLAIASAEIKIKVIDPQDATVADAQVQLLRAGEAPVVAVRNTTAEGMVFFRSEKGKSYQVRVLAPGFAPELVEVPSAAEAVMVRLRVSTAAETVVVTATRSPLPEEESASSVSLLSGGEIEAMQPASLADALRFLPGAAVNVAG